MSASTPLAWYHSLADNSARLVLLAIADHDGEGGAWPSVGTLARMTRLSESTVRRCLKALVALGELAIHQGQGGTARTPEHLRPNRYEIRLACPPSCDGTARHACRGCGGRGVHKGDCPVENPPKHPLSPVTPPVTGDTPTPVTGDTPTPVTAVTPEPPKETPKEPPRSPQPPPLPDSVARLWTGEGISEEHQAALWALVLDDPGTLVPAARARQRAWFVPALATIRARDAKHRGEALTHVRRFGQACEHGMPGGAEGHPVTGLPLCPLCRSGERA